MISGDVSEGPRNPAPTGSGTPTPLWAISQSGERPRGFSSIPPLLCISDGKSKGSRGGTKWQDLVKIDESESRRGSTSRQNSPRSRRGVEWESGEEFHRDRTAGGN
jgi:hypothetical protein